MAFDEIYSAIPVGSDRTAFVAWTPDTGREVFVTDGVEIWSISNSLAPNETSGACGSGLWVMDGKLVFAGSEARGAGCEFYAFDLGGAAQPYGKGSNSGARLLAKDPHVGEVAEFDIRGPKGATQAIVVFGERVTQPILLAQELIYLNPVSAQGIWMPLQEGSGSLRFEIPDDPSLVGISVTIQAALMPHPNLLGATLTAALSYTVGN
jgi:hypothetical protein